jgi:hypothetical protein
VWSAATTATGASPSADGAWERAMMRRFDALLATDQVDRDGSYSPTHAPRAGELIVKEELIKNRLFGSLHSIFELEEGAVLIAKIDCLNL